MSPMEQALRDEIAWHETEIAILGDEGGWYDRVQDHRARLAALTAALPAPGDAVEWVMVPRVPTEAMILAAAHDPAPVCEAWSDEARVVWTAMLSAAPSPPVEISQAQAMREAFNEGHAAGMVAGHPLTRWHGMEHDWEQSETYAALAVSPPAAARPTPGGPDVE